MMAASKTLNLITTTSIQAVPVNFSQLAFKRQRARTNRKSPISLVTPCVLMLVGMQALTTGYANASDHRAKQLAAKTIRMTGQIVTAMTQHYSNKPEGLFGGTNYCREDGYCGIIHPPFSISIYGAGLATVQTSTQSSFTNYVELCAVTFSAISGSNIQFSTEAMTAAFGNAARHGRFKTDLGNVQIRISPGLNNIQSCQFFKYGQ